jgi:hypothetical protein
LLFPDFFAPSSGCRISSPPSTFHRIFRIFTQI